MSVGELYSLRENSFNFARLPIPLNSYKNNNKRRKFDIFSLSFAFTIPLTLTLLLCGLPILWIHAFQDARHCDDRVTPNNLIRCILCIQNRSPVPRIYVKVSSDAFTIQAVDLCLSHVIIVGFEPAAAVLAQGTLT